jgi:hypothetical protein
MLTQNDANTANWGHDTKIKQHGMTGMGMLAAQSKNRLFIQPR